MSRLNLLLPLGCLLVAGVYLGIGLWKHSALFAFLGLARLVWGVCGGDRRT